MTYERDMAKALALDDVSIRELEVVAEKLSAGGMDCGSSGSSSVMLLELGATASGPPCLTT